MSKKQNIHGNFQSFSELLYNNINNNNDERRITMTITMMIMMTMLITLPLFTLDSIYSAVNLGARKGEIWPIPPLNVTSLK